MDDEAKYIFASMVIYGAKSVREIMVNMMNDDLDNGEIDNAVDTHIASIEKSWSNELEN